MLKEFYRRRNILITKRMYFYSVWKKQQPRISNYIVLNEGDTPLPLAYCVPPYFGLAYRIPPFFGLAYCVPFNNKKTTILGVSIYTKKIKLQYAACTCTIILKNNIFDVFAC